jgi:hypothetical protein
MHDTTLQMTAMFWEYWHVASETTLSSELSHANNRKYGVKTFST